MATEEYKVGFGKPPKSGQWKRGQSGNPAGLPKGTPRISASLQKLLRTEPREVFEPQNKADVLAIRLFKSAMEGDTWACREILD